MDFTYLKKGRKIFYNYIVITRKSFFYGVLLMLLYIVFLHKKLHILELAKPTVYINLIFLGLFSSSLAFIFYKRGVEIIGSVKSANYIYLVPLLTALFGIVILHERIDLQMCVGGVLILLGLYISQKR